MTSEEIYKLFRIPKNLQWHMLRVAAVGWYVCEHFVEQVNQSDVVNALLLHDLGNLLKFNLSRGVGMFDESEQDVDHWRRVQAELARKYSSDEHEATAMMTRASFSIRSLSDISLSFIGISLIVTTVRDVQNIRSACLSEHSCRVHVAGRQESPETS